MTGDGTTERCPACGNLADAEDPFCANCGREMPAPAGAARPRLEQGFVGFDCRGCGASMTFDAGPRALRCAFCGSVEVERQPGTTGRIRPTVFVPFALDEREAAERLDACLGSGLLRPAGLRREAVRAPPRRVWLPCWSFAAEADTRWAADSDRVPFGARASWRPVYGEGGGRVEGVLVPASGVLSRQEVVGLEPWDLGRARAYEREALGEDAVEDFGLSRRGARPLAVAGMEAVQARRAAALIPGRVRNLRVNCLFADIHSEPVLLPVWILPYRWKGRARRLLVNGQTGRTHGRAPVSAAKVALLVAIAAALLLLVAALR